MHEPRKPKRIERLHQFNDDFDGLTSRQQTDITASLSLIKSHFFTPGMHLRVLRDFKGKQLWYMYAGTGKNLRVPFYVDEDDTWWLLAIIDHNQMKQPKRIKELDKKIKRIDRERKKKG